MISSCVMGCVTLHIDIIIHFLNVWNLGAVNDVYLISYIYANNAGIAVSASLIIRGLIAGGVLC